jgi:tetratricopeptide (TPR) repeat protein
MLSFFGCEKLKPTNLKANYNVKKGNGYYTEEKYRKAVEAYETALELNPELKFTYVYLGTSYSSLYRPGKEDERNVMYGEKGIEYLKKAMEFDPENDQIVLALGDLYDKMAQITDAENCYLQIKDKRSDDPKAYYTLANFYSKNAQTDKAEEMYNQRIELNPEDPEGYHYKVGFLQDQRRWPDAIVAHEQRLYAMLDSSIILTMREIAKLQEDAEQIEKITDYIELVKKNKRVAPEEKKRLIDESNQKLEGKLSLEETNKKIEELTKQKEEKIKQAETTISGLEEKMKQQVSEAYYSIGNVCWNWSYQTPIDMMAPKEREPIVSKGMDALQKAIDLMPEYANPYSYMGLLWREKIKINPLERDQYVKKNEEYNRKFLNIYKRVQRSEAFKKELEKIGQESEDEGEGN